MSNLEHELGHRAKQSPHAERTTVLQLGDPADGVRSIAVHGLLDQAGSVRLLRLVDSKLDVGAEDPRGLRALLVDLTGAEVRGHGAASVLAHAAEICERRRIDLAIVGPPPAGATPSATGQGRYRTYASADEALRALDRSGDSAG